MLLGASAATLLGRPLTGWGVIRIGEEINREQVKIFNAASSFN